VGLSLRLSGTRALHRHHFHVLLRLPAIRRNLLPSIHDPMHLLVGIPEATVTNQLEVDMNPNPEENNQVASAKSTGKQATDP
jgi:hypothetical protein